MTKLPELEEWIEDDEDLAAEDEWDGAEPRDGAAARPGGVIRIYPYAVSRNRLERAIAELRAPVQITDDLRAAHGVLTLKGHYRKMPKRLREAERNGLPIHVIRSNTVTQMQNSGRPAGLTRKKPRR